MTRILFVFSPIIFCGLYVLMGETIHWFKKRRKESGFIKVVVFSNVIEMK
jgi:hypothetical protein